MKAEITTPFPAADYWPDDQVVMIDKIRHHKVGNVIDLPDAYKLVHGGIAKALDDECREAAAKLNPKSAGWMLKGPPRIMEEFIEARDDAEAELNEETELL